MCIRLSNPWPFCHAMEPRTCAAIVCHSPLQSVACRKENHTLGLVSLGRSRDMVFLNGACGHSHHTSLIRTQLAVNQTLECSPMLAVVPDILVFGALFFCLVCPSPRLFTHSFIHFFFHSFSGYQLRVYAMPATVPGTGPMLVSTERQSSSVHTAWQGGG